ncbi:hypothetical protein V8E36_000019 [Tilletia maclaganii]
MSEHSDQELVQAVRQAFPAVAKNADYIFSENAGGSQVLGAVASKITSYLLDTNVQMANYPLARTAEPRVQAGYQATALLMGDGISPDEVLFGASATQLVENLSRMIEESSIVRRQIVISEADHETNRGAWKRLAARRGLVIRQWNTTPISADAEGDASGATPVAKRLDVAALAELVNDRTRLVCFTACSNACELVKEKSAGRAWTCVDVQLGADFVFWSWYKLYGPHLGSMYLSHRAQKELLTRLNHEFLHPYAGTYELIYSTTAVVEYLIALGRAASTSGNAVADLAQSPAIDWAHIASEYDALSTALDRAYEWISAHEGELLSVLVAKLVELQKRGRLQIVGDSSTSPVVRAPTAAFVPAGGSYGKRTSSASVHAQLVKDGKRGAQQGHMYALQLIKGLGLEEHDGVVRVSLVHYNTVAEAQAVGEEIEKALSA